MDEKPPKFTTALLKRISCERSVFWSTLFERFSQTGTFEELHVDELEEKYIDKVDENHCSDSENMAEEVEEDDEKDLDSSDRDVMLITRNLTVSNADGILAQINDQANETGIIGTEVQRVLEETLPVVEEYKRDWVEGGFEKILKTFDLRKIEETFGSLRFRNDISRCRNSYFPFRERFQPYRIQKNHGVREYDGIGHYSDSDSLHSDDQARYIRSSRKHVGMQKRVATTTTTIKSYRLVESKRDELHKKYAFLAPDETMQKLNKKHCRPISSVCRARPEYVPSFYRIDKLRIAPESLRIRRRRHRHAHRRVCNSPYSSFSSSEEELSHSRARLLRPSCCQRRNHYALELPRSSRKKHLTFHDEGLDNMDEPPFLYESECSCNGSDMLCNKVRHLANSSSENWLVENCESSSRRLEKVKKNEPKERKKRPAVDTESSTNDKKLQKSEPKSENSVKKTVPEQKSEKVLKKSVPTRKVSKSKNIEQSNINTEDPVIEELTEESFERELQKAIKLSKELYERELKSKKSSEKLHSESQLASQLSSNLHVNEPVGKNKDQQKSNLVASTKRELVSAATKTRANSNTKKENKKIDSNSKNETGDSEIIYVNTAKPSNHTKARSNKIPQNHKTHTAADVQESTYKVKEKTGESKSNAEFADSVSRETKEISTTWLSKKSLTALSKEECDQRMPNKICTTKSILKPIEESEDTDMAEVASKQKIRDNSRNSITSGRSIIANSLSENTTFFANSGNICNSTAMANNTAISRQLYMKNAPSPFTAITTWLTKKATANEKSRTAETHRQLDNFKTKSSTVVSSVNHNDKNSPMGAGVQKDDIVFIESSDCLITSSTTDSEIHQQTIVPKTVGKPGERVLLYTPKNLSLAPNNSIVNGRFQITEDHLATIIGRKKASKFMKYYVGPREFLQSSTIYYKPPSHVGEWNSSDSDIDIIDLCFRYGKLEECKEGKRVK